MCSLVFTDYIWHRHKGAIFVEDVFDTVSSQALYEKLEQAYRLICAKVSSRSIGSGQGRYLQLLLNNDGLTQTELVPLLGVSASTASEQTDKLLAAGHIIRKKAASDKRRALVYITDSGREAAESFRKESEKALQDAFGDLSKSEQDLLLALLCKLTDPDKPEITLPSSAVSECDMIRPGKRL